jgi:ribosomal protein S18 acetylase RimI-like enzyme
MRGDMKNHTKHVQERLTKLRHVESIDLGDGTDPKREFTYIMMQLPAMKLKMEKLAQMEQKAEEIRPFFKTRFAIEEDIPALVDLYNVSFFQAPEPYRPITTEDMQTLFDRATIIIGSLYNKLSSFIILKLETQTNPLTEDIERVGFVCGIAVHPTHREKGVATAIGLAGWNYFADKKITMLKCEVYEKNEPSLGFITWVGFRPVGELIVRVPDIMLLNPLERL